MDCFGTELSIYDALNGILEDLAAEKNLPFQSALTKDIHVLPDFNGNRCESSLLLLQSF